MLFKLHIFSEEFFFKLSCGRSNFCKAKQPVHHQLQVLIAWFGWKTNLPWLKRDVLKCLKVPKAILALHTALTRLWSHFIEE